MRWPIRYQILIPFAAAMLLALLVASVLNAYLAAKRSERQIEEQLRNIAQTLESSTFPLSDAVLRQMQGFSGAEFQLETEAGEVIAASRPLTAISPSRATPQSDWRDLRLGAPLDFGDQRYFEMVWRMPPKASGEPRVLHILYPESVWREARREAALPPLVVGGVALLAVALLAVIIADRLSRPIIDLRTHVARLTEADFKPIEPPSRNDELRDLALSVNHLAAQLDDMRRAIQRGERLALLGQLAGGMAHHLRNDVTGARMAVQLHQRQCTAGDAESLEVALRQLALTEEHLKRILTAGQPPSMNRVDCDLSSLLDEAVQLVEPSLRHRKVELIVEKNAHLPPIQADPDQLRHLILNLLLNASDAAGPGGWVRIDAACDDSSAVLRVLDSGSGPPAAILERLFEPFMTSKSEGVGLGLSVARQIATAHGGELRYTGQTGTTCFELKLPAA